MALRQIRLHLESAFREGAGFFLSFRGRLESVIDPALQLREARAGQRKVGIELQGALVELLGLFQLREILQVHVEIVCLDKREVGLAVLRRLPRHLLFLGRRKFRVQLLRDFLCEIGLDREHIREIAIVTLGPDVLVVQRVDELHIHVHAVAGLLHAPFEDRRDAERFADFPHVYFFVAIWGHRGARDHFQVADLREVCENVVLDAVGEVGVLLVVAAVFEGQDSDRFVHLARGSAREQEKAGRGGDDDPDADKRHDVTPSTRGRRRAGRRANSFRSNFQRPRQDK